MSANVSEGWSLPSLWSLDSAVAERTLEVVKDKQT